MNPSDAVGFIAEHSGGKARQEITGRGEEVKDNPEEIFKVLLSVFGEGEDMPALQQRFYSFVQGSEDILTCSLTLVDLYDRITELDDSFKPSRESLKDALVRLWVTVVFAGSCIDSIWIIQR